MLNKTVLLAASCAVLGVLVGCSTSPEQNAAYEKEEAQRQAEIAARQGPAVTRICPGRSDGWQAFGKDALLREAGGRWYRVELAGACDPEQVFAGLATRGSPGSSCVQRGDRVFTARPRDGERCTITAIHEWNNAQGARPPGPAGSP